MEKKRKTIQVYAIIVNIVAIITFLIAAANLITAVIDRSNPIYVRSYNDADLSSFEKYKLDVLKDMDKDAAFLPGDETIRGMYESAKEAKINSVLHQSFRTIVVTSVIIVICIILFGFHWWLAKKYGSFESG